MVEEDETAVLMMAKVIEQVISKAKIGWKDLIALYPGPFHTQLAGYDWAIWLVKSFLQIVFIFNLMQRRTVLVF